MAIKRGSKVDASFSAASMTDLMFLLLVFMLISMTLVTPNALKLILPKSSNQVKERAYITVSITPDNSFYVGGEFVSEDQLESAIVAAMEGAEDPVLSIHGDEKADWGGVSKVMNIANKNNYTVIAGMRPE